MDDNPLATSQSENAGANTFDKFEFQYHWALCRILDKQKNSNEYALFMEYHEDVVISDSLESTSAKFEFNQVKNIKSPKYTIQNLTKHKKGKNSVLGKLITSVNKKSFEKQVSTINLVASCGFSIDQLDNDESLEVLTIGDLSASTIKELKDSIQKELGRDTPDNLCFVIPDLGIQNQQDATIGRIAALVSKIFPGSYCSAENIYRALIDDLHRKGTGKFDYHNWVDALERKALTSTKVTETINTHVEVSDMKEILSEAAEISKELEFSFIKKKQFKNNIERIHLKVIGFPTSLTLKIRNSIKPFLSKEMESSESLPSILKNVIKAMPSELKDNIGSADEIQNHVLYEIIVSKHEH